MSYTYYWDYYTYSYNCPCPCSTIPPPPPPIVWKPAPPVPRPLLLVPAPSSSRSKVEPEEGYCFLLCFRRKYWDRLRQKFGPNTHSEINTPLHHIVDYMQANPHRVSSRRDLTVQRTGEFLCHISTGGKLSPWEVVGAVGRLQ